MRGPALGDRRRPLRRLPPRALGLPGYEARVLAALIASGAGESRQIAAASGVPRTSVYRAAGDLVALDCLQVVPAAVPATWRAPGATLAARWSFALSALRLAEDRRHYDRVAHLDSLRRRVAS